MEEVAELIRAKIQMHTVTLGPDMFNTLSMYKILLYILI